MCILRIIRLIRCVVVFALKGCYGDFSQVPDYMQALNIVKLAEEQFAALSVELRNEFDNDPAKFLAFCNDEKNADRMSELGLLKPEAVERRRQEAAARDAKIYAEREAKAKADRDSLIADVVKAIKGA